MYSPCADSAGVSTDSWTFTDGKCFRLVSGARVSLLLVSALRGLATPDPQSKNLESVCFDPSRLLLERGGFAPDASKSNNLKQFTDPGFLGGHILRTWARCML